MATTTNPIIWDFYRQVPGARGLGCIAHQYDENSQSVYLNNGLKTRTAMVAEGDWKGSTLGSEQTISSLNFYKTDWDQPFQNMLAGVGVVNGDLYYLCYDWITSMLTDIVPNSN